MANEVSVPTVADGGTVGDLQAAFAVTLVDEWARGGVTHAVVCPGSRSTPLAVALAADGRIRVHMRLDERSAAFTALGIGKADGRPAVVLTTSGTAAAELHPAVVEADLAAVPMIACTADRPPERHDVGAPQTIDQTHLFGRSVRWFADPGVPDAAGRSSWRSLAARAVSESTLSPVGPGPVHLNLPFREPLLGHAAAGGGASPGRPDGSPWHLMVADPSPPSPEWISSSRARARFSRTRRGLIVAGAGAGAAESVLALSAALGWPVLADPRSRLRSPDASVIAAADGILRSSRFAGAHVPEVVLALGERWASSVVNRFLTTAADSGAQVVAVDPWGRWTDPERRLATLVRADPGLFCRAVVADLGAPDTGGSPGRDGDRQWIASWQRAEVAARRVIGSMSGDGPIDEPGLASRLFSCLPPEATLVVSSSMPVRDLEAFGLPRPQPPLVLANRGANGIDGVVSTAIGVALGRGGHVSALVGPDDLDLDLTIVVADNAGGGIFSFLAPAAALDPLAFDRLFGTPQAPDPAAVAAGFGWEVDDLGPATGPAEFEAALGRRLAGGMSVIRVRLPERAANVTLHDRINTAIIRAVDDASG